MHTLIRLLLTSFILIGFLLHLNGAWSIGLIAQLERLSYDARVGMSLLPGQDDRVVIIDIDEKSMRAEGQWPWPRTKLAELVDALYEYYGISVLGIDSVFPEPDGHNDTQWLDALQASPLAADSEVASWLAERRDLMSHDDAFAVAIRRHQPVMGYVFKGQADTNGNQGSLPQPLINSALELPAHYVGAEAYTANLTALQSASALGGFFDNPLLDNDGVFRRVPLLQRFDDGVYGSLALMSVWRALGQPSLDLQYDSQGGPRTPLNLEYLKLGDLRVPVDENVAVLVPYRGKQGSFPYVSVTDVLKHTVPKELLVGKIALLGTSAPGLRDLRTTPVEVAYSGVEIHANIIAGMLDGRIKKKVPYLIGIETSLMILIGLVLTLAFPRVTPLVGTLLVSALVAGLMALSVGLWQFNNFVMPLGGPLLYLFVLVLVQMNYGYFVEARAKREVSRLFGHYVPPELVAEMAQDAVAAQMRSDSREMTVLFSDVRDFTSISEKLSPDDLTTLMNEFLTPLTEVIHRHRGTIDKYMGDAVMAFWGAPLSDALHARHALETAMEMVVCMRRLGEEFKARNLPELKIGVGVNTGVMSVGNMGSEFRMAYTVLGDAVNLGSRLEGLTKPYGVDVICGDATRRLIDDWAFRDIDRVRVKGKSEPVGIFEPLGPRDALPESTKKMLSQYRQALLAYRNQDWIQAELQFFQLQKSEGAHPLYQIYLDRIANFKVAPPPANWDGVYTHSSK